MNTITTDKGVTMNKLTRALAIAGISGALAVGGAGVAQASTGHGQRVSPDKAQSAKLDRSSRDKNGNSRDKGHGKDKGKSKDKGKHKHDHGKNHK